jgi:hypothetical protein
MIHYSENEFKGKTKEKIDKLLGESISIKEQLKFGAVGSELYRLRRIHINERKSDFTELNTRCNFHKYRMGLLLRINHNMHLFNIAMGYDQIDDIVIKKGREHIAPFFISPMNFLLHIGVHIRYARYFKIALSEYYIEPMIITIKSKGQFIELDTSGWNYYGESKYFNKIVSEFGLNLQCEK